MSVIFLGLNVLTEILCYINAGHHHVKEQLVIISDTMRVYGPLNFDEFEIKKFSS